MEGLWFIKNLSLKNILKFKSKRYVHETFILVKKILFINMEGLWFIKIYHWKIF